MKRKNVYLADISAPRAELGDGSGAVGAPPQPGTVFLVGAGPGNPDLLTVRAHRLITNAKVIAHDELVAPEILALAPRDAELFSVGRRAASSMPDRIAKNCSVQNARIHAAVISRALAGHDVIRLKGGDPYIFGRGGEEAEALEEAGIPYDVVPGISAALGAAASVRVPLTYRAESTSVTLVTAHAATGDGDRELFSGIPASGTVVFYMGLARLESTLSNLIASGRAAETPAIVISHATLPTERFVAGNLSTLANLVRAANLPAPALLIVGEAVAHRSLQSRPSSSVVAESVLVPAQSPAPQCASMSAAHSPPPRSAPRSSAHSPPPQSAPSSSAHSPPPQSAPRSSAHSPPPQSAARSSAHSPPPQSAPRSSAHSPPPRSLSQDTHEVSRTVSARRAAR